MNTIQSHLRNVAEYPNLGTYSDWGLPGVWLLINIYHTTIYMYVYVHICMYMFTYIHIRTYMISVGIYIYIYIYIYICVCVCSICFYVVSSSACIHLIDFLPHFDLFRVLWPCQFFEGDTES